MGFPREDDLGLFKGDDLTVGQNPGNRWQIDVHPPKMEP